MDERKDNILIQDRLDYICKADNLPIFTPEDHQIYRSFCRDIIYLFDVGREQISAYPWALEVSDTPLPAEADLLASVASPKESRSSRKEDAERQTQQDPDKPYPKGFDASKKESVDRIAIKIQPQLWEKNNGEIKILRYDGWFQVDDLLLQKVSSTESPKDAMRKLFQAIKHLAFRHHVFW
ncbi:hypothetical protein AG0111_0g2640 [Alternaria gaisen]|uniref:Uncharacterized protein n=1 Tax=Alternaria gaisen TaxID=167740 RepID=A0ACB6FXZ2_9PLEO|nr:hypothetical protein AG0111_0g2640 [Alternaria gaisen]